MLNTNNKPLEFRCGYCKDGAQCGADGACSNGCVDGWSGTDCRTAVCSSKYKNVMIAE